MEMRPPRMDDSGRTKYPVLFRVYVRQVCCNHALLTLSIAGTVARAHNSSACRSRMIGMIMSRAPFNT